MATQIVLNTLSLAMFYILIASGLSILLASVKIFTFAHGTMYMLGGFGIYTLFVQLHVPYLLGASLAVGIVGLIGVMINRIFLMPVRKTFLVMVNLTIGLTMVIEGSVAIYYGAIQKYFPSVVTGLFHIGGATISLERLIMVTSAALLMGALFVILYSTKLGRAIRAVGENEEAARLQGINPDRISTWAMFIGSSYAGVAGVVIAPLFATIDPYMGTAPMIKAVMIIMLGGLGSLPGCIVAGFILGGLDSIVGTLYGSSLASIIGFAMIIFLMVIRPGGLLGHE